jgi:hypothetical protein
VAETLPLEKCHAEFLDVMLCKFGFGVCFVQIYIGIVLISNIIKVSTLKVL